MKKCMFAFSLILFSFSGSFGMETDPFEELFEKHRIELASGFSHSSPVDEGASHVSDNQECPKCGSTEYDIDLRYHLNKDHGICDICMKGFENFGAIIMHQADHQEVRDSLRVHAIVSPADKRKTAVPAASMNNKRGKKGD